MPLLLFLLFLVTRPFPETSGQKSTGLTYRERTPKSQARLGKKDFRKHFVLVVVLVVLVIAVVVLLVVLAVVLAFCSSFCEGSEKEEQMHFVFLYMENQKHRGFM